MSAPSAGAPPQDGPVAGPTAWQRWRKWISLAILLAGIGYLVLRLLQAQPVDVEVSYSYGRSRAGLREATMRYLGAASDGAGGAPDGEELRRITFRYGAAGAPATQAHAILIQQGEYSVSIELRYDGAAPPGLGRRLAPAPGGGERIELKRPLFVSGAAAVTIFVDPRGEEE